MTSSSTDTLDRIVEIADRFEADWRRGQRPRIEDFLEEAPPTNRAEALHSLLGIEVEVRRECGESPRSAEYAARLPADGELIDAVFSEAPDAWAATSVDGCPPPPGPMPVIPGYRLVGRVGSGASSEVWLADDEERFE